ncbi:MAG: hypothetical protein U1F54_03215 [Burkholderiales bacterium]
MLALATNAMAREISAVEYWHEEFNHYFLTTSPEEMAALDAGKFAGWVRFLPEFKVYADPGPGLVPVCRFFSTAFAPKSSHFFTAFPEECQAVKANPAWTYEGVAFYAKLPDANGACAPGTMAVYRSYNGGTGGAPAHRYTPYLVDSCYPYNFFGPGCVREGVGPDGVGFCAPVSVDIAFERTKQMAGGTWDFRYTVDNVPTLVSMAFGAVVMGQAPVLPPQWLGPPYYVVPFSGPGAAGWDPIMGRIDVGYADGRGFYSYTRLVFDFDGVNATNGCMYLAEFFDYVMGPCHPLTAVRRYP